MKKVVLMIVSVLIYGVLLTGCVSDKVDLQDGIMTELPGGITEEPEDEIPEEAQDGITYPKFGKYELNILADGFVEATEVGDTLIKYAISAELPAGNSSLKIVIRTKSEKAEEGFIWGRFYSTSLENWSVSSYDSVLRGNTFTVYESGIPAHASLIFESDCIIEYYENGATAPTKVKELKVGQDVITEKPQDVIAEELNGVITYPKFGKYGLNILADDFVEATGADTVVAYSMSADLPVGNSSLKIVIRAKNEERKVEWGGFYSSSLDNWLASRYDTILLSNTFTVYESGIPAHASLIFISDCIIEYYENGATTPTKVKEIKVGKDVVTEEPPEVITEGLDGVITYPKFGKYGLNILADSFVEATVIGDTAIDYSMSADLSAGNSSLKIILRTKSENNYDVWGGFFASSLDNWLASRYDTIMRGNTFTVYESGKIAHGSLTFFSDCIVEYYENGAKTPTKVKEIKVGKKVIAEEPPDENTGELNGKITYPTNGKYGLNILADGFVEAIAGDTVVEYSMSADLSAGNSKLKIVLRTKNEKDYVWGGFYDSCLDNWLASRYDNNMRGNTFTVYESGKIAHATIMFVSDCIVEYYENGATTPTKVKEIKVIQYVKNRAEKFSPIAVRLNPNSAQVR